MHSSCALADCIWSDQTPFCFTLQQAAVPLDRKWPFIVLYLRGIKENGMLSERQKKDMQDLLLGLLDRKDFSLAVLEETERRIHSIITAVYAEKIREIANETSELAKDMHAMFGRHHKEVSAIASKVDDDMAKGVDPTVMLTDLRSALKNVMTKMAEDAHSLMTLSQQDSLTGLANRRRFDEFLYEATQAWVDKRVPVNLIMMDIDHFKQVNDSFGHRVGDQVLQALAGQIKKVLQPLADNGANMLAARYGGEEFAIVLCGESSSHAVVLAEVIRKSLGKIAVENGGKSNAISLTVSFGVASLWEGWKDPSPACLVDFADKALYQAKSRGRNCTVRHAPESEARYELVPA